MRWLVLAIVLGLAGCGGSPPTHYYSLVPVPSSGGGHFALSGPPLQVGQVNLPPLVDRSSMVITGPGPAVTVSNTDVWAAPLSGMVQHVLSEDLADRLGSTHVVPATGQIPPHGVRIVVLNIQRFSGDSRGQVVLDTDWSLTHGNPPHPGRMHHARITEEAGSTAGAPVAAAMSRALASLADQIASGI